MSNKKRLWKLNPDMPNQIDVNGNVGAGICYRATLLCEVESEQDARLIAAAPEMLKLIVHLSKLNLRDHKIENRIAKLLKKVKEV